MTTSTDHHNADDAPAELGSASTVEYTRAAKRKRRRPERRTKQRRSVVIDGAEVVSIYEPDVRSVPPLRPYLRSLWERRAFMMALAQSKVRSARAGTFLGPIWALLDPIFQIAIYFFIFTTIRSGDRPSSYLPMLIFGILHFQLAATALSDGGLSVTSGRTLMLNSTFPRALLPLSSILTGVLKFLPSIPILAVALVLLDVPITWGWIWWPILLVLQILIGLALALFLSTLVVFFRDVKNLLSYVSRIMFFTAPVMYPASVVPDNITDYIMWMPLYGVFANYQGIITGEGTDMSLLWISVGWAVLGTLLSGWVFLRYEREFSRNLQ